jgi:hypothetical protein
MCSRRRFNLLDRGEAFGVRNGTRFLYKRVELGSLSLAAGSRLQNLSAQLLEIAQDCIFIEWLGFLWVGVGHDIVERDQRCWSSIS